MLLIRCSARSMVPNLNPMSGYRGIHPGFSAQWVSGQMATGRREDGLWVEPPAAPGPLPPETVYSGGGAPHNSVPKGVQYFSVSYCQISSNQPQPPSLPEICPHISVSRVPIIQRINFLCHPERSPVILSAAKDLLFAQTAHESTSTYGLCRKICSIFCKNQTNFRARIALGAASKDVFLNYPHTFSLHG